MIGRVLLHCLLTVGGAFCLLYLPNNVKAVASSKLLMLLLMLIAYWAIMALYLVVSVVFSVLSIPIDRKLGRRKTMISSALVYVVGKIWFVLDPFSYGAILVNALTVAYAMTLAFVLFNTNRNNIADLIEWKSGRRIDSLVSTCDNLASKLAKAGANLLMTGVLAAAGFNAELATQPQSAIDTICALLGWVPMLVAAVMMVIVFFHPIEKEMTAMKEKV